MERLLKLVGPRSHHVQMQLLRAVAVLDPMLAELESSAEGCTFIDALTRILACRRTELEVAPTPPQAAA